MGLVLLKAEVIVGHVRQNYSWYIMHTKIGRELDVLGWGGKARLRELRVMSFFEATPSPLPAGWTTVGPGTSLPVQVGTESGAVTLPSVLWPHWAGFQPHSRSEKQLSSHLAFCSLGQLPWTLEPLPPAFWAPLSPQTLPLSGTGFLNITVFCRRAWHMLKNNTKAVF